MITSIIETYKFLGLTFRYVDVFLVTLLCLLAAIIAGVILPKYAREWCYLRRIPAMDAIDESIQICAEKGRPFLYSTGSMGFSGTSAEFAESLTALARFLTSRCANLGVRFVSMCNSAELQLVLYDFARQGYISAGKPEMFQGKDVMYIQSGTAQLIMEHVDFIRRDKPAAFVGLGHWLAGTPVPIFQEALNNGSFVIGSTYWPDELSQLAQASDFTLMTAEMSIIGSYIDNDPEKMSVFIGEDFAKLVLVGITIGLAILWVAGIKIFP